MVTDMISSLNNVLLISFREMSTLAIYTAHFKWAYYRTNKRALKKLVSLFCTIPIETHENG